LFATLQVDIRNPMFAAGRRITKLGLLRLILHAERILHLEQSPGRKKAPARALSLDALVGQLLAS